LSFYKQYSAITTTVNTWNKFQDFIICSNWIYGQSGRDHHHHHHHVTGFLFPDTSPLDPVLHSHHFSLQFQIVELFLLRKISPVQLIFCRDSTECFLALV